MAVRVAWFKVYYPEYYYVSYFTLRCDAYELETMLKDADSIYARMKELQAKMNSRENPISKRRRISLILLKYVMRWYLEGIV